MEVTAILSWTPDERIKDINITKIDMNKGYIKVRPYVAKRMGKFESHARFNDGNVMLWIVDLMAVDRGYGFRLQEVVGSMGGLFMNPQETADEQVASAENCRPLPVPTDPEWMPWPDEIAAGLAGDLGDGTTSDFAYPVEISEEMSEMIEGAVLAEDIVLAEEAEEGGEYE